MFKPALSIRTVVARSVWLIAWSLTTLFSPMLARAAADCTGDVSESNLIAYGELKHARLSRKAWVDTYIFTGKKGDVVEIGLGVKSGTLDARLELHPNSSGTVLAANDDWNGSLNPYIKYTLPNDAKYSIWVLLTRKNTADYCGNYILALNLIQPGGSSGGSGSSEPGMPNAPSNLTIQAISGAEAKLTWRDNSNFEAGFSVKMRSVGSSSWTFLTNQIPENSTSYTVSGLTPGKTYEFQVMAWNGRGTSYAATAKVTMPSSSGGTGNTGSTGSNYYPSPSISADWCLANSIFSSCDLDWTSGGNAMYGEYMSVSQKVLIESRMKDSRGVTYIFQIVFSVQPTSQGGLQFNSAQGYYWDTSNNLTHSGSVSFGSIKGSTYADGTGWLTVGFNATLFALNGTSSAVFDKGTLTGVYSKSNR